MQSQIQLPVIKDFLGDTITFVQDKIDEMDQIILYLEQVKVSREKLSQYLDVLTINVETEILIERKISITEDYQDPEQENKQWRYENGEYKCNGSIDPKFEPNSCNFSSKFETVVNDHCQRDCQSKKTARRKLVNEVTHSKKYIKRCHSPQPGAQSIKCTKPKDHDGNDHENRKIYGDNTIVAEWKN